MRKVYLAIGLTLATALGCSSNSNDGGTGGSTGTAGSSSTTGGVTTSTGGKVGSGGASSTAGSTSQSTAIGGNTSSADSSTLAATGGKSSSGGASNGTGGLQATGGTTMMAASGGMSMGGTGMMQMGGASGVAGSSMMASGGSSAAMGGATATMTTGGTKASGGTSAVASTAGASSGGFTSTSSGTLTLTIDASLGNTDPDAGTPNTVISTAVLLNKQGAVVATATLNSGSALFSLTGIAAGDYFIEINGDTTELVPTRIDDPTVSVLERTSPDLSASYIGPVDAPIYRINTYVGDDVLAFSSGAAIASEAAYVVLTLANPQIEFRVLGTGALLSSLTPSPTHTSGDQPFDSWLLNTPNQDHHGDMYNSDPTSCATCHKNMDIKPTTYSAIKTSSGWCYRCHNGTGGPPSGIFDSAK